MKSQETSRAGGRLRPAQQGRGVAHPADRYVEPEDFSEAGVSTVEAERCGHRRRGLLLC